MCCGPGTGMCLVNSRLQCGGICKEGTSLWTHGSVFVYSIHSYVYAFMIEIKMYVCVGVCIFF